MIKYCKTCKKILGSNNKSGYCIKCVTKSPEFLKRQREYQREYIKNPEQRKKQLKRSKEHRLKNPNYYKEYLFKYTRTEKGRKKKRDWARRNLYGWSEEEIKKGEKK